MSTAPETTVVVLGASGFVGSAVSRALARRPGRLLLVSRHPAPRPAGAAARVEIATGDLTDPGTLADAVAGADAVVHLVAYTEGGWRVADDDPVAERVNVGVLRDLLAALRAGRRGRRPPAVLFAGTESQAGATGRDRIDGTEPDRPCGAYARQKLAAERLLKQATAAQVVRGVSLRLSTVYGHGPHSTARDRGVVSSMVRRALAGEPLTVWGDGAVRRDLLYVEDAAAAFDLALDHVPPLAGGHWLVGGGTGVPLRALFGEIARQVAAHTGQPPVPVVRVPAPPHAEPTDLASVEVDTSAFRSVTGWRPAVPWRDGVARTVAALAPAGYRPAGSPGHSSSRSR